MIGTNKLSNNGVKYAKHFKKKQIGKLIAKCMVLESCLVPKGIFSKLQRCRCTEQYLCMYVYFQEVVGKPPYTVD